MCSDGDLMEGIGGEAASLAGHLKLSNLCWMYDHNHITLDGPANWSFSEDVATRFVGYGWNVTRVADANDLEMLARAFDTFHKTTDRPTLIIVDSHIGYGSPHKQDTNAAHGEPSGRRRSAAGQEILRLAGRRKVPGARWRSANISATGSESAGAICTRSGRERSRSTRKKFPDLAERLRHMQQSRTCRRDGTRIFRHSPPMPRASRLARVPGKVLNVVAQNIPWLIGGSADLATSNKTTLKFEGAGDFQPDNSRRTQPALRRARTRDGRERERHDCVGHSSLRRDVLQLQRLHAGQHPVWRR